MYRYQLWKDTISEQRNLRMPLFSEVEVDDVQDLKKSDGSALTVRLIRFVLFLMVVVVWCLALQLDLFCF